MTAPIQSPHPAGARQIIAFGMTGDTGNYSSSTAAGAPAVVSATGDTKNRPINVDGIYWSYSTSTPVGSVILADGSGNVYAQFDITEGGFDQFKPPSPIMIPGGATMTCTLAGTSGATGRLYVSCWRLK